MTRRGPLAVAHRGGNSMAALRRAAQWGVDMIELDVQPGRLEVRHAHDLSPIPLLVDGARLLRGWGPRLLLPALLEAADALLPPTTRLLVDLKGTRTSIGAEVAAALEGYDSRQVLVCGKHWAAFEAFERLPEVGLVLSAGNADELARLRRCVAAGGQVARRTATGASVAHELITPAVVAELGQVLELVLSWTVNRPRDLDRMLAAGVGGVISDRADLLARVTSGS